MTDSEPQALLTIDNLSVGYAGQPPLVSHWSAAIGPGLTLLHGDTGSGKTTIVKALAGVHAATGRLTLAGATLSDDRAGYLSRLFYRDAAGEEFDQMNMRETTAVLCGGFDSTTWQALVEGFALTPHIDKPLYMLSTGSKRKVWLAAAIASGRKLILLDEPTAALDGPSIRHMWKALSDLAQRGDQAVLLASADPEVGAPLVGTISLPLDTLR